MIVDGYLKHMAVTRLQFVIVIDILIVLFGGSLGNFRVEQTDGNVGLKLMEKKNHTTVRINVNAGLQSLDIKSRMQKHCQKMKWLYDLAYCC